MVSQAPPLALISPSSKAPLIAGLVIGVLVPVLILLALLLFYMRRCRQAKDNRQKALDQMKTPELRKVATSSPFDPFGARLLSRSPRTAQVSPPSTSRPQSLKAMIEDHPTPDIEKGGKSKPPPLSSHPAYQALYSSSPSPELYQHYPRTPIGAIMEHPAYHASQLGRHPVFRSGPSSPPGNRKRSRLSPPRRMPRSSSPMPNLSGNGPLTIRGHIELEAGDVPSKYLSPAPRRQNTFSFMPSRSRSSGGTYSIPIGLGFSIEGSHNDFGPELRVPAQRPSSCPPMSQRGLIYQHLRAQELFLSSSSSQQDHPIELPAHEAQRKPLPLAPNSGTYARGTEKRLLPSPSISEKSTHLSPGRWGGLEMIRETVETSCDNRSEKSSLPAGPGWKSDPKAMKLLASVASEEGSSGWGHSNSGPFGPGGFFHMGDNGRDFRNKRKSRKTKERERKVKTPMTTINEEYDTKNWMSPYGERMV